MTRGAPRLSNHVGFPRSLRSLREPRGGFAATEQVAGGAGNPRLAKIYAKNFPRTLRVRGESRGYAARMLSYTSEWLVTFGYGTADSHC
jgi:hypothetical protein